MAGKSGSSQRTCSKVTNVTATGNGGNSSSINRHKNYPFNHHSSTPSYSSHLKSQPQYLHPLSSHSSASKLNAHSPNLRCATPSSKSFGQSSRINSSSSLTSYSYGRSPLANALSASPSTSSFQSYNRSPLASIASPIAPVTCSMFYKNALRNRKNKRSVKRENSNRRDTSPAHPSALVSYLRDSPSRSYEEDFADDNIDPLPPSMELMIKIPGYESITFNPLTISPPEANDHITMSIDEELSKAMCDKLQDKPDDDEVDAGPGLLTFTQSFIPSVPELTKQEARTALLAYASNRYCYKTKVAKQMTILKIENCIVAHYTLESFTEKRTVNWSYEPYTGGSIDSLSSPIESNSPPDAWSISVKPSETFTTNCVVTKIPHTELIKVCNACGGVGRNKCTSCHGVGWKTCLTCNGDGYKPHPLFIGETEKCYQCNITGSRRCSKCTGDRFTPCKGCKGKGQIKCYIKLSVHFTNHQDEYIHVPNNLNVPMEQVKLASGNIIHESVHPVVHPITHYPESGINLASKQLHVKHSDLVNNRDSRLILQRQRVRIIPMATVHYEYKSHPYHFYVFGFDRRTHAPHYPSSRCCCLF